MLKKFYYAIAGALCLTMASCSQNQSDKAEAGDTDSTATEATAPATDKQADAVIEIAPDENLVPGELPIVVDFWATWCGPCMQFKPIFHQAAEKYAGKATFAAVDIDKCVELAQKHNVQSIPTVLILMPDGTVKQNVGFMDAAQFDTFLGDITK